MWRAAPERTEHMKKYWELFIAFARVGVMTFGGGYAMIPILERELIDKRGWTTNEELMDYYAVAQCTPGVIAEAPAVSLPVFAAAAGATVASRVFAASRRSN